MEGIIGIIFAIFCITRLLLGKDQDNEGVGRGGPPPCH